MTRPGTPTAETWNKQVISPASWGFRHRSPPASPQTPQKLVEQNLTSHQQRGYLVAKASSQISHISARQSHCKF